MRQIAIALLAGLVFGLGLALSGMTSPLRVLGFLDITGAWDPRLAFVMGAGLLVAIPLFALARSRAEANAQPVRDPSVPARIDLRLLGGAAIFGIGWGLAGLCPGPAVVDLVAQPLRAAVFLVPMALGLLVFRGD